MQQCCSSLKWYIISGEVYEDVTLNLSGQLFCFVVIFLVGARTGYSIIWKSIRLPGAECRTAAEQSESSPEDRSLYHWNSGRSLTALNEHILFVFYFYQNVTSWGHFKIGTPINGIKESNCVTRGGGCFVDKSDRQRPQEVAKYNPQKSSRTKERLRPATLHNRPHL